MNDLNKSPNHAPSLSAKTRCEFCDITLKTDIDIGKHLVSSTHNKNKGDFLATTSIDKTLDKQIPKNFNKMLHLIKARNIQDIRGLNDEGFFKVHNESEAKIAQTIAQYLVYHIIEMEDTDGIGQVILEAMRKQNASNTTRKEEPTNTRPASPELDPIFFSHTTPNSSGPVRPEVNRIPEKEKGQSQLEIEKKRKLELERNKEKERLEIKQREEEEKRKEERKQKEARKREEKRQKEEDERKRREEERERKRQEEAERKRKQEIEEEEARQRSLQKPAPELRPDTGEYKIKLATIKVEKPD